MNASHLSRCVIVDFSPGDESIPVYQVARAEVEKIVAVAPKFPVFFDETAAIGEQGYLLDDEFARRIGVGILNALALSYPELKSMITATNQPIPRAPAAPAV
ncbi:MAG: hypothetical protein M3O74_06150 [Pseudomonadota bacterium]|uniref:hypothetical protein n=1 Tax=Burkholderia sp. PAMC 28687 TaxID=1795874 RepID=UPI000784F3D7|nr:hypothetical protein [Burkholderia sp. PAMC 28687]AMM13424.1 hypothetical protein AX768_04135 [Burkholderia sp. PAMC 28687]MDP9153813.1 hypothetical protein [Pseudomonadota bacterium]